MSGDEPIIPITAKLTLASPDLYLALVATAERLRRLSGPDENHDVLSLAYAALAKANGVQNGGSDEF